MNEKWRKALILSTALFLCGIIVVYIGIFKGHDIAINVSRPYGASGWTTSQQLITGCTYLPVIVGLSLLILSIIFYTILFYKWITHNDYSDPANDVNKQAERAL